MKKKTVNPPLNKDIILTFLRANKELLQKEFGVTKIGLCGSFARDEAKETSDIDVLIEMKVHSFDKRYDLKEFLEKKFKRTVDVGYFDSVRSAIMHHIQEDLIYA